MRTNIVKLNHVISASDLDNQIERLNTLKEAQEEMLKENLGALSHSLQPGVLFKKAIHKFSEDEELKQSTFKSTLNFGTQFLLDKIMLGKGIGIKGYLLNMALKKVATFLIGKNNTPSFKK
jgi:hypothetical protein